MHTSKKGTIYLFAIVFAGCAHYQPKPLDLQTSAQALAGKSLNDPAVNERLQSMGLPTAAQTNGRWNRAQLLVIASESNASLRVARTQLRSVSAAAISARALPNPTLSLGSEYSLSQSSESPWLWSLTTDWLLDVGLRRQLRIQLADNQVRVARLDYADAVWTARSQLRTALVSYLLSAQRAELLTSVVTSQERLLALLQQRVRLGEAATTEVLPVELELARARSNLADSTRVHASALAQLAQVLGMPVTVVQQQTFDWEDLLHVSEFTATSLSAARDSALLSRVDLERAVLTYQQRELELQQAIKQQYPQLSIGPGYTWDHGVHKATLGVSFSLPVLNRNQGPIAEAEAQRSSAGEQVLEIQSKILNDIDAAMLAYQSAVQLVQGSVQQNDVVDAQRQQAERALALGAGDQVEATTARVVANTQALAVLDAIEVMQTALGQLEDALHMPLSGPELQLKAAALTAPQ